MVIKISNVILPERKQIFVALQSIFGIGKSTALKILKQLSIDNDIKTKDLTEEQSLAINKKVSQELLVENDLKQKIKRSIDAHSIISCRIAIRRSQGLPLYGCSRNTGKDSKAGSKKGSSKIKKNKTTKTSGIKNKTTKSKKSK